MISGITASELQSEVHCCLLRFTAATGVSLVRRELPSEEAVTRVIGCPRFIGADTRGNSAGVKVARGKFCQSEVRSGCDWTNSASFVEGLWRQICGEVHSAEDWASCAEAVSEARFILPDFGGIVQAVV